MQYYVEVTLLPNDDIGHYFLWGKVYQQLHLALVALAAGEQSALGICFPEYSMDQPRLGRKVRIFADSQAQFTQLDLVQWFSRLSDYCHISSIKSVPAHTQYAQVARKQCVTSPQRLARRRAKRKGQSYDQALVHFTGFKAELSRLPFVVLHSESTHVVPEGLQAKHRFKLFIAQVLVDRPQTGAFTCYGLSQTATVPWF
ncbi:type I-F CRISPR-associated endoribonuclease Cas6/Csy4 [Marinagarivorans algicola]|uniref:type I-F CRISPR-associated endoribonuclease Cas6/Csy4 n=1 Tax=Marinagarivorans algicola TaxID=1513270 RepID=UPI0006B471A6|nr:type I-F CRISPR-associated endoribonuclease Cas6/Csy4 [Marinagarivorans algicola]